MGLFDKTPKYDIDLEEFETSEPNHASVFNKRVEKLIQSLEWMKENTLTKAHIIRSTEIEEDGHLMDGKILSEFLKNLVNSWDKKLTEALRKKVDCVDGKGLSANDFTDALKEKLDQISEAANKYIHPIHTSYDSGLYKIQVDEEGHIVSAELVTKEDITELGIPGQDTNTTYGLVSTEAAGLAPRRTGTTTKYLRDDGIWAEPPDTDTTYGLVSTEAAGLAPRRTGTVTKYLRDDGRWEVPPDTTYGLVSTEAAGLAPKRTGTTTKYLRDDGRWEVPPNTVYGTGNANTAGIGKLYAGVGNNVDGSMTQKAISDEFTKLNKNIVFRSGTRTIKANTTGAWYRLGHARKVSSFYGEFLIWHQWTSNPSTMSKLIVGINTAGNPSSMIKEVFCTCMDTKQSPPNKRSLIQKARAVYYPSGSWNYDICVDIFIKTDGYWVQGDNQWWYTLSREMHPQSLNCEWVDDVFGSAGVSSPYVTQEFSFV
ncbi:MAG: hypothetical protein HFG77_07360 [Hungatella sp.]|nr:hypothetical protein [Dorea sp.]MCI9636199.1 hypothetical protein [Hungatella sp.]